MESADDFLPMNDALSSHSESSALPLSTPFVSNLDAYLRSTLFDASLSPPLTASSHESTPSPEERKEVKKRHRKKQPKLESCTAEQIARRREQNRKSQRAYRERREAQLQALQDRIDEVELQNEKLQAAHESLRSEVAALRSGSVAVSPKGEELDGGSFAVGPGQSLGYLAFDTGLYHTDGDNGFAWGLGT